MAIYATNLVLEKVMKLASSGSVVGVAGQLLALSKIGTEGESIILRVGPAMSHMAGRLVIEKLTRIISEHIGWPISIIVKIDAA